MAELNVASHKRGKRGIARRAKKLSTRIDLTPMVDLGFLLITFFIVTTTWSKPKGMDFYLQPEGPPTKAPVSASLTIVLLKGDKIFYYHGTIEEALQYHQYDTCGFSFDRGIGDIIRRKQLVLDQSHKFKKGRNEMVVMIKPTVGSDFKNIIKLFDGMLINKVGKYSLMDLSTDEKKLLVEKKLSAD